MTTTKIKTKKALISIYLLVAIIYLATSNTGDLWSCVYFVKDNLFIITTAFIVRYYFKLKIIPDLIIAIKTYATISVIARFIFNFTLFYDYSFIFLTIFITPLIAYEWRTITKNKC